MPSPKNSTTPFPSSVALRRPRHGRPRGVPDPLPAPPPPVGRAGPHGRLRAQRVLLRGAPEEDRRVAGGGGEVTSEHRDTETRRTKKRKSFWPGEIFSDHARFLFLPPQLRTACGRPSGRSSSTRGASAERSPRGWRKTGPSTTSSPCPTSSTT